MKLRTSPVQLAVLLTAIKDSAVEAKDAVYLREYIQALEAAKEEFEDAAFEVEAEYDPFAEVEEEAS